MALPKRRHSKTRARLRRTHWKLNRLYTNTCPQCQSPKLPHRVCPTCGSYNGREVINVKTDD